MPRKANSPAAYADVKYILDLAVKKPGLKYKLKSPGAASNFIMRCNLYRQLLRQQMIETHGNIPGYRPETVYDQFMIRKVNERGETDKKFGTVVLFEPLDLAGEIIDPETGEVIKPELGSLFLSSEYSGEE